MTTDTVGGVWTFTQELAIGLLEQGCDVMLVSVGRLPGMQQQACMLEMNCRWPDNFCFRRVDTPLEWMLENGRAYVEAAPFLQHCAGEFNADLFHANQFCFGALPLSIPKIVTAHSDVLSWAAVCRDAPLEDSAWLKQYCLLVMQGLAAADAVVGPTSWMLEELGQHFDLPQMQQVIPNGRTLRSITKKPRKLQAVTAGRVWDEAKSICTLSDVVSPIPLVIAGETCCEQTSAPAAFGGARLLGTLSEQALLSLFQESAIYICTSQYEPFGLAPLEAALCGCAILANDIASLREVWNDGAMYFRDATVLSQILQTLYDKPKVLARAQERSFRRAQRYTRSAMTLAYLASYKELALRSRELSDVA